MGRKLLIAAIYLGVVTSNAEAALLLQKEGAVLVNKGKGFSEVTGIEEVNPGDRVLVRGEGHAQIDYGDGCLVEVASNQTAVVSATSAEANCDKSALYSASSTSASSATGSLKDRPTEIKPQAAFDDNAFLLGGLVVAAGTAVAISVNDKDKPASP